MSYTAMFAQDTTPYDLNKNLPPKSSLKRNFTVFTTSAQQTIYKTYTNTQRNGKGGY